MTSQVGGAGGQREIRGPEADEVACDPLSAEQLKGMGLDAPSTQGAPGAKRTARPKSQNISGVSLQQQLEEKLEAAGGTKGTTAVTGTKWPLDQEGIKAAIEKAFPGMRAYQEVIGPEGDRLANPSEWAIDDPKKPGEAAFMWVEFGDGEVVLSGEENFTASAGLKAGDDLAAKLQALRGSPKGAAAEGSVPVDDNAGDGPELEGVLDAMRKAAKDTTPLTKADEKVKADIDSAIEQHGSDPVVNAIATAMPGFGVDPTESPLTWVAAKGSDVYLIQVRDGKISLSAKDGQTVSSKMPPPVQFDYGPRTDFYSMTAKLRTLHGRTQTE